MNTKTMLLLGLLGAAIPAAAEDERGERGERVRITTSTGNRWMGRVTEETSDAIVVELDGEGGSRSIPLVEVAGIEHLRPRSRSEAAWSRAKWGALLGAVPGAISLGLQHEQVGEDGTSVGGAAALGAWSGGLLGGLIGAAVGALNPGEEWVTISTGLRTGRDAGFSLSVTFEF